MTVEGRVISLIKTENRLLCDACIGKLLDLGNIQNPTMVCIYGEHYILTIQTACSGHSDSMSHMCTPDLLRASGGA